MHERREAGDALELLIFVVLGARGRVKGSELGLERGFLNLFYYSLGDI